MIRFTAFGMLAGLTIASATAENLKIELPAETPGFKQAPGVELAMANCLICHSSEYVSMQPVLPRTYWEGAVAKMQKVFGAPIQPDHVQPLVDYLVKNYGKENPPATPQK